MSANRRTRFDAAIEKRGAVDKADAAGVVSDSMAVREVIVDKVASGEITLEEGQRELKRLKRAGKAAGKPTRANVWNRN